MGRLLITSYHTPGCVVHSYNDCVTTTVRWCEECKGGLYRWSGGTYTKVDPNPRRHGMEEVWGTYEEVWPA
jgi:hypothetical protein